MYTYNIGIRRTVWFITLLHSAQAHPELLMQLLQMPFQSQMMHPISSYQYQDVYNQQQLQQLQQQQIQQQLQQHRFQQQQLQNQQYNQQNHQNSVYDNNQLPRESPRAYGVSTQHRQAVDHTQQQQIDQQPAQSSHVGGNGEQTISGGGGSVPPSDYPRAYRPTQAHIDFGSTLANALNPPNSPHEFERRQQQSNQQQRQQDGPESFGFAPGTPVLFCGYGLPIPQYDTPRKKCIPWHPLCGITFTCIMDV